jgi:CubicO group peptidase (beta-lactamase class C family)
LASAVDRLRMLMLATLVMVTVFMAQTASAQPSAAQLEAIRAGLGTGIETAGIVVATVDAQGRVSAMAAGCARFDDDGLRCVSPLHTESVMRVASLAKLLVAAEVQRWAARGRLQWDQDAGDLLRQRLRNPRYPDHAITIRQLLNHTSSLRDIDESASPSAHNGFDNAHPPGAWFYYANINYVHLAHVLERLSGERFDRWIGRSARLGAANYGGFDWSMPQRVPASRIATLYRKRDHAERWSAHGPWYAQADDFKGKTPESRKLDAYRLGADAALLSPASGLRASLPALAQWLSRLDASVWAKMWETPFVLRTDGMNGDQFGNAVMAIGAGAQAFEWQGVGRVWGHFGIAYGLRAALLREANSSRVWAYAITGYGADPDAAPRGVHGLDPVQEAVLALLVPHAQPPRSR